MATIDLAEQLGPFTISLFEKLESERALYWLDSGSLLGVARDGRLPSWDKDIDLGVWEHQAGQVWHLVSCLAEKYGCRSHLKKLGGRPYAITVEPFQPALPIPLAIHIFHPDDAGYAVSPQPHLLLSRDARYICSRPPEDLRHSTYGGAVRIIRSLRRLGLLRYARFGLRALKMVDPATRSGARHPLERLWGKPFYATFRWRVPAHHFEVTVQHSVAGLNFRIPSEHETYLSLRYGTEWHVPLRDWFYVLDDATLEHSPNT